VSPTILSTVMSGLMVMPKCMRSPQDIVIPSQARESASCRELQIPRFGRDDNSIKVSGV
jgi:hypothetical protein